MYKFKKDLLRRDLSEQVLKKASELNILLPVKFKNLRYLAVAITHSSFTAEHREYPSNEKLEFLGDSLLNFAVAKLLFLRFPDLKEGDLSKLRAYLIREENIYLKALDLSVNEYIYLGKGEEKVREDKKPSILADCFEAIVAALYFDSGFLLTLKFIEKVFAKDFSLISKDAILDYKTSLQEESQKLYKSLPSYSIHKVLENNEHIFVAQVFINGEILGEGKGLSKKKAEEEAAKHALEKLIKNHENL